ncbi:MAG: hypothetical protein KF730_07105 [Sphingomonas sp.]|uniref:hypothetical protein n=1 Tax=Sphingomonas sp. TaxID=28214 RepID=UPI0025CC41AF|nr:hypothetical protein [Sphingomonas sp.]MBX3564329.1 hypothetical protein [Sphingomonas sp.]
MAQNDSSGAIEKWRAGVRFSSAWFEFGDPYAVRKFRETTTRQAFEAEQFLMVAELWAGLRDGEFQAFGKCVEPEISKGPVPLPLYMFEFDHPRGIENSDDIEISGWRYEGVKVIRVREPDTDGAPVNPPLPAPDPEIAIAVTAPAKRGGGRRHTYRYAAEVLQFLYEKESNRTLSAEILHPDFKREFERRFPVEQYHLRAPSPRTLRDHIKQYRQELEDTGKN